MPNFKRKIDDFIVSSKILIDNAIGDGEIKSGVQPFGYGENKLAEGKSLHNEVSDLFNKHKKEYGEQIEASDELNKAWEEADKIYMKTLKIARIALQNNVKAYTSMMIHGERKNSLSGWLIQTAAFYTNLLNDPAMLSETAKYGRDEKILKTEYEAVKKVEEKALIRKKETGEAHEAKELRDKKIDELDKWISDFKAILKIAFEDDMQKLERLGIIVKA